ncbi:tRNA pseudouridine(13) synthase TruD [Thalassotalea sp. LPB0316]|uniref:tRNA pseudouridine(13) synthase TruD n=1 Tax=Thalassotalea sp. LPB0316 TaxID=2769490 RepID=UPI0018684AD1|nr:tRNA pseudouridine(13) synthase TruD [Thalassotalea sp. LPB0316]QOL25802.1 tRNA pseudouridine(13) synthase TruD [Thalassotalea sp. LPB0316]
MSQLKPVPYLYGEPQVTGKLRSQMSDFKVFEILPFEPCGEGEHLIIHVRKTGANTVYVARELAKYFKVSEKLVTYAGLKDRFAVCEQSFGVHLPGKQSYDLSDLEIEGVEVLSWQRHNKKLKTGALIGNRFEITLADVSDMAAVEQRWQQICQTGVPNYFGEQRFGIDGGNIERAHSLFAGNKVKDKKKRSIYLSTARSLIFNEIIAKRINTNTYHQLQAGDVCMLAGTQSVFLADSIDQTLENRLLEKDIDITASMWGAGELMTTGDVAALEQSVADEHTDFAKGLAKFGLKQERRRIRLNITQPKISINGQAVTVSFFLPSGCFATTVLRELIKYQDMTVRV